MKFQLISSLLFVLIVSSNAWDLDQLLESSVPDQYSDSVVFAKLAAASQSGNSKSSDAANASDVENSSESKPLEKAALNASEDRVVLAAAAPAPKKEDKSKLGFSIQKNSTDESVIIKSPKGDIKVTFIPTNQTNSGNNDKNQNAKDGKQTNLNVEKNGKSSGSNSNGSGNSVKGADHKGKSFTFDSGKSDGPKGGNSIGSNDLKGKDSKGKDSKGEDARGGDARGGDAKGGDSKGKDSKGKDAKGEDSKGKTNSGAKPGDKSIKLSTDSPKMNGKPGNTLNGNNGSKSGNSTAKSNGSDKQSNQGNQSKASNSTDKNFVPPAPTLQLSNASLKYDKFSFKKSDDKPVELKTNGKGKPAPAGQTNSTLINKMTPKPNMNKPGQKIESADKSKAANSTTTDQKRTKRSVDEIESLRFVSVFRKIGFWAYLTILGNVNVF